MPGSKYVLVWVPPASDLKEGVICRQHIWKVTLWKIVRQLGKQARKGIAPIQSCGGSSCVCGALVLLGPWGETKDMHQNPPWEEGAGVFIHQFSEKPWFLTSVCCQRLRKPWGRKEGAPFPRGRSGALGLWMGRQVPRGLLWDKGQ